MDAVGTMDLALCKVGPDPIFFYPIPDATYPATAKFTVKNTGGEQIAYKIRYRNKHPKQTIKFLRSCTVGPFSLVTCHSAPVTLQVRQQAPQDGGARRH